MEKSAQEEEECGICLDSLKNPVSLPCNHKFCSGCLNGWRSRYGVKSGDTENNRKCPMCREKIPPSKEMVTQLKYWRDYLRGLEAEGDICSENYLSTKSEIESLEREIGDWTETIDYSDDNIVVLPTDIYRAAKYNNIQKVLNWLGPPPVDKQRLNAKNPDRMEFSLVFGAVIGKNNDFLSILLQLGADVDPINATGATPLSMCFAPGEYAQARLLLEWGAEISNNDLYASIDEFIECARMEGNTKLVNLMNSEYGGRRCEIINLSNRPDLIGKTCVVEKYLPSKGRYKVIFEVSKEVGLVGPENLKRHDRTPDDCGYYISYKNGRTNRHEFASKEECQAFVASMKEEEKSEEDAAEAEARAEEAAATLLAELDLDTSADSDRRTKKGGKKGKKKKGRK